MATRREAREQALSLCYEMDVRGRSAPDLFADLPVPPDDYTRDVVEGVDTYRDELDAMIDRAAEHWSVERMAVLDRAALRIGAYELAHRADVPTGVAISEAVELAKRYSTEESGRFVNGVLAALAADLRSDGGAVRPVSEGAGETGGADDRASD